MINGTDNASGLLIPAQQRFERYKFLARKVSMIEKDSKIDQDLTNL